MTERKWAAPGSEEREYQQRYFDLVKRARAKGLHIFLKPDSIVKDYGGMNWKVAHLKGYGFPINEDTIYIASSLNWRKRYETLRHELIETKLMDENEMYWPAHCKALKDEHYTTPLPDKMILVVRRPRRVVSGRNRPRSVAVAVSSLR